jgi:Ion channel
MTLELLMLPLSLPPDPLGLRRRRAESPMLLTPIFACLLVAVTAAVHAVGLAGLIKIFAKWHIWLMAGYLQIIWTLIGLTLWLSLLHSAEIAVWGLFYLWQGCLANAESAFYFAGVTYTTLGYGDLVLVKPWRMLAPIEALTGILMCGLSAGVFFAVTSQLFRNRVNLHSSSRTSATRSK